MSKALLSLVLAVFAGTTALGATEEVTTDTSVQTTTHVASGLQWLAQASIVMPQTFTLTSPRYEVPYADNFSGFPGVHVGAALPLFVAGPIEAQAIGLVGYGFKEGIFSFHDAVGNEVRDLLRLHRIPMSAGVKFLYHIPWLTFVKPSLTVGGGAQWMIQAGRLEGVSDNFMLPFYYFSPALTFFENRVSTDWFGGFTFGISYQNDLHPKQVLRAWSFDLSVNLFL